VSVSTRLLAVRSSRLRASPVGCAAAASASAASGSSASTPSTGTPSVSATSRAVGPVADQQQLHRRCQPGQVGSRWARAAAPPPADGPPAPAGPPCEQRPRPAGRPTAGRHRSAPVGRTPSSSPASRPAAVRSSACAGSVDGGPTSTVDPVGARQAAAHGRPAAHRRPVAVGGTGGRKRGQPRLDRQPEPGCQRPAILDASTSSTRPGHTDAHASRRGGHPRRRAGDANATLTGQPPPPRRPAHRRRGRSARSRTSPVAARRSRDRRSRGGGLAGLQRDEPLPLGADRLDPDHLGRLDQQPTSPSDTSTTVTRSPTISRGVGYCPG
jgi:hypothetical protein